MSLFATISFFILLIILFLPEKLKNIYYFFLDIVIFIILEYYFFNILCYFFGVHYLGSLNQTPISFNIILAFISIFMGLRFCQHGKGLFQIFVNEKEGISSILFLSIAIIPTKVPIFRFELEKKGVLSSRILVILHTLSNVTLYL